MDRRTETAAGSGSGGAAPTAVTSRGAVDEELDDLSLDEELRGVDDADGDEQLTGVMAPPKRSGTRKPPTRKPAGGQSSNGRSAGNGSGSSSGPGSGPVKKEPANADGGQDEKVSAAETTAVLPAVVPADEDRKPSADSSETSEKDGASESTTSAPGEPKALADDSGKAAESGKADEPTASAATPAMPADDIWMPRTSRQSSDSAPAWTPVEASERPRGNAFEVNDAFSAPPMPSDTTFTPAPAAYPASSVGSPAPPVSPSVPTSPSKSPSNTSSFGAFAAAAASDTAKAKPETKPPSRAFPRPAGKGPAVTTKPAKPSAKPKATVRRSTARQAHLTISRVEPWSVMKFSFAVSVVAFIVLFVAVALLFAVLSALGVFDSLQHLVNSVTSSQGSAGYNVKKWFTASRILSYTAMLGGINIVLITAISTIGSVIYNLASRLIGGVEVTLKETD